MVETPRSTTVHHGSHLLERAANLSRRDMQHAFIAQTHTETIDALWTDRDLSFLLGVSIPTLRRWRQYGHGPRYIKIGSAVRFRTTDVASWMESIPSRISTSDVPSSTSSESESTA